ncbi:heparinase II/III family protein [Vibrio breoganii]|uniref:heparinase II/III family protein n=1 Tax=Vibrio breoganii TaxID=553239 RepID=UPI000C81F10B|nr:heparinase II/III family protein [Vibrio breoganii]PML92263.1 heparinase [Vibrio breoganii]PMN57787.1 heparinase [Vibrio breoganii]
MQKYLLLFNTLRHLKPIQLINRIQRRFSKVTPVLTNYTINSKLDDLVRVELLNPSLISENQFKFLNHIGEIGSWNDSHQEKLWLYNLHYFDDLNAFLSNDRKDKHELILSNWFEKNPPMIGNGWEPYPLSLRTVNWIKYFSTSYKPNKTLLDSLFLQADALAQSLEYHLLGNHLFANGKALVFAGAYFEGDEGKKWLNKGLEILDREIPEQVLHDGANFELSPMYHHIILADMLDMVNLAKVAGVAELTERLSYWEKVIEKMITWAEHMSHPDGEVSFFNDSAMGIAPKLNVLLDYAHRLGITENSACSEKPLTELTAAHLKESGYVTIENVNFKALLDVAKIGPDYIPGHGHADTLSFEMSAFGQRLFVNSGTGEYGLSEERLRQRKTSAHNTVEVDAQDSSEVWSGFRVARRAYPSTPTITQNKDSIVVECSHNGYKRLKGKVTHFRKWSFSNNQMVIEDTLSGQYQTALSPLHIHPDVTVREKDKHTVELILKSGEIVTVASLSPLRIEQTTWHPQFGITIPNKKIVFSVEDGESKVTIGF